MLEIERRMQVTLVAYYGKKPEVISNFIRSCQDILAEHLLSTFHPYDIEQVHGTIIGLEGYHHNNAIINENFLEIGETRNMDIDKVLNFLRSSKMFPINIRMGGFRNYEKYCFTSRGKHPYLRSFSIQKGTAVAMGWPIKDEVYPNSLDDLRRKMSTEVNVLHKYHKKKGDIDNDFYLVLGDVDLNSINEFKQQKVEEIMRLDLAGLEPVIFPLGLEQLSVVGYLDTQLPKKTSCCFCIQDLRGENIEQLYPQLKHKT